MLWVQMQPVGINYTAVAAVCVAFVAFVGLGVAFRIHWALLDIHEELHDIATELRKAKSQEPS
jgi:hypothetical protein